MKAAVFGEILFDLIDGKEYAGGAAFNFAAHLTRLGFATHLISCVGEDRLGREALAKMQMLEMNTDFIRIDNSLPTGTVSVQIKDGEPEYDIHENAAWDSITVEDTPALSYTMWDLFYFGTLAQRSDTNRETLTRLLDETVSARHVFFDVNLRRNNYSKDILEQGFKKATTVKTNLAEAREIALLFGFTDSTDAESISARISREFGPETVVVTDGAGDIILFGNGEHDRIEVSEIKAVDPVGTGDAFSAGFCFGLLQGLELPVSCRLGAQLGAFVASRHGAIPEYTPEIMEAFLLPGEDDTLDARPCAEDR